MISGAAARLLKVFVLTTILAVRFAAHAGGCGPDFVADDSVDPVRAAVEILEDSGDAATQLAMIQTLFTEGRQSIKAGVVSHSRKRSLMLIMPMLFYRLFEGEERVRRAAAFAIAGFRQSDFPDTLIADLDTATPELEARVRDEIEHYLVARESKFFQYVHVTDVVRSAAHWRVKLDIEIKDELPLSLAGRAPRTLRPRWLTARPNLNVVIHERDGRVYHELEFTGRNGRDLALRGSFTLELPTDADPDELEVYLDIKVDGHYLERMLLPGRDLLTPTSI